MQMLEKRISSKLLPTSPLYPLPLNKIWEKGNPPPPPKSSIL